MFMCVSFRNHSGSSVRLHRWVRLREFLTNVNISDGAKVSKVGKGDNRKQTG